MLQSLLLVGCTFQLVSVSDLNFHYITLVVKFLQVLMPKPSSSSLNCVLQTLPGVAARAVHWQALGAWSRQVHGVHPEVACLETVLNNMMFCRYPSGVVISNSGGCLANSGLECSKPY